MKSETHFSREAIEIKRGKVLKESSINARGWSSSKLFIVQNYAKNANGNVHIFSFFEFKVHTCSFFIEHIFILWR